MVADELVGALLVLVVVLVLVLGDVEVLVLVVVLVLDVVELEVVVGFWQSLAASWLIVWAPWLRFRTSV